MYFRLFIIFILGSNSIWARYYNNSYEKSSYNSGYSNNADSSSDMSLNLARIDIRMENFLRNINETQENIEPNWYRLDENGNQVEGPNYQNNILKILIKELEQQFENSENDRAEMVVEILQFLNEFIKQRFIAPAYQTVIRNIFNYTKDLQNKPAMQVTNTIFNVLSDGAKNAFQEGIRVQASGLNMSPTGRNLENMKADPILVELLFLQVAWDAQKRNSTRQELLNTIEKSMVKMEQLFGSDPAYTVVGTFSSLRATLVEEAQNESPLPDLIKYIISLFKHSKKEDKKEIENLFRQEYKNNIAEEWEEITKQKAKPAVSVWKKVDLPHQETQDEKEKREAREANKNKKKQEKSFIKNLKEKEIDQVKGKGIDFAKNTFEKTMNGFFGSLSSILGS